MALAGDVVQNMYYSLTLNTVLSFPFTKRTCCISTGHLLPCGRHRGKSLRPRECISCILPRACACESSPALLSARHRTPAQVFAHPPVLRKALAQQSPQPRSRRKKAKADGGGLSKTPDKVRLNAVPSRRNASEIANQAVRCVC